MLAPLPYPVYFVRDDPELCEQFAEVTEMPPFQAFYRPASGGSSSWIVQTYLQLKCRGLAVRLVPHFVPGMICVVSREELMKRRLLQRCLPFHCYLVVCQQDRPRPFICQHRVVQNQLNVLTQQDHFLPHWSQPDLQVRDGGRGDRLERLVFKGRGYYLPEAYRSTEFMAQLKAIGVDFATSADYEVDLQEWTDYTTADALLAVRHRADLYLGSKPPTKLINAWMAGCPALLGAEPAFQALRQSALDYIEVNHPAAVIQALQQLQANPKLYRAMIENGWQRSRPFQPDQVAQQWRDLLAGAIATGYQQWQQANPLWTTLSRPVEFGYQLLKQEQERRRFNQITGRKRSDNR